VLTYDVVTCGFAAAPVPAIGREGAAQLPDPLADDFLETAFAALDGLEHERRVLLVHPAGRAVGHRLGVLRAALRNPFVLPVALGLPVTGLAGTAAWLGALGERDVSAGTVLAQLDAVRAHLPTYAVTTAVGGLELPEVGLRHHLLSWVPGTVFAISMASTTRVELGGVTAAGATGAATVVWSGDERLATRIKSPDGSPVPGDRVRLPEEDGARSWWNRARSYEQCVVPHDVDAFADRLRATELSRCPTCGDAVATFCSFCLSQKGSFV
jgi:hypothetical protein